MRCIGLIISYFRFAFQIVLLLLILSPALARGLEDKVVFVSKHNGTPEVFLVEGLDGRPIQLTRNRFASWPSISPDGTEVVFVSHPPDRLSNILILHLATNRIEKLTNNGKFNTEYRHLDWSPDSQHILYSVDDFGVPDHVGLRELFITDDNGNRVKKVEQDLTPIESLQRSIMPTWSPKRSEITYFGFVATNQPPPNPWQIYSMNLNDGSITALTSGGAEDRFPWAWRPDGQKILFIISSPSDEEVRWSHIYVMDPDGENMINLTQASKAGATWSPDGKQIAFSRGPIFVMDADGQNQQRLTFEPAWDLAPHWSPDGGKIAFLSYRDGVQRIYTVDTNGQNVQQITHRRRKYYTPPAWSPDGRWLAFGAGDGRSWGIYLIDPQGDNETFIVRTELSELTGLARVSRPTWAPDSQHLIYIDPESEDDVGLMKISVDGGMPMHLKTVGLEQRWLPVWSPDGNSLLFSAREQREPFDVEQAEAIFLINLDTSDSRHFILPDMRESGWNFHRLVWAPDGSQLMLSSKATRRLYLIDIASETVRLWMDDATEADWVRPGFVYAVNPRGKHIATWAQLKTQRGTDAQVFP